MSDVAKTKKRQGRKPGNSFLLEVVATNRFCGRHILLRTHYDANALGIRPDSIRTMKCFPKPELRGFRITGVPPTNSTIPGQEEVIEYYLRYPALFNFRHNPVIGKALSGPFHGEQFALFSVSEITHYFSIDSVRPASCKQATYANIAWRKAESIKEAEQYYCCPEQWRLVSVFRSRYKYPDIPITLSQDNAFRETVRQVSGGLLRWYHENDMAGPISRDQYVWLAIWHQRLDNAIQCHAHYYRVRDTLLLLQDILVKGHSIKPLLFIGHCKILERLANQTLPVAAICQN